MTPRPSRLVLLGHPVRHSLSPTFQNAALRHAGIPARYEALDVPPAELHGCVRALIAEGAAGNVTVPHKEAVAALCSSRTPLAERAGAVNTFWVERGALIGDNTDVAGFASLARQLLGGDGPPRDLTVAVLGAGGAAAAVLTAIECWPNCTTILYNRTPARRDRLARRFAAIVRGTADDPMRAVAECALVVNATSVGLADDALPVPVEAIPSTAAVLDLVYRPGETAWVRAARARGLRAADGVGMLVEQGAAAFERWFGVPAPREVMWRALAERLAS
jgi:shikimate dehydrogenase